MLSLSALFLGAPQPSRAELQFASTTVKLGKIKTGGPQTETFAFVVTGTDDVVIEEIRPSCGCVTPELPRKTWAPGETGKITLSLRTLGVAEGTHRWYAYVLYRQGEQHYKKALQMEAELVAEVQVQPAQIRIHADGPLTQEIRLIDTRSSPLKVTDLKASVPFLHATCGQGSRDGAGRWIIPVSVRVEEPVPLGKTAAWLTIRTSDPDYQELQVLVTVDHAGAQRYSALPGEVRITGTKGQSLPSKIVVIRDTREEPVIIKAITTDDPAIHATWASGPGDLATVKIQVDAAQVPEGGLQSTVHVHIAGPGEETVSIPVICLLE